MGASAVFMATSFEKARSIILDRVRPLEKSNTWLNEGLGSFLAEDLRAQVDNPRFDNSSVDGYAARADDLSPGVILPLQDDIAGAGEPRLALEKGHVMRIFTGAQIPKGADCVVMQEDVEVDAGGILFSESSEAGSFIRRKADEYAKGDLLLPAGTPITPPVSALLAANGLAGVMSFGTPRVHILSTGNELAGPGDSLTESQIYDGNGEGLLAAVKGLGISHVELGRCRDDFDALRRCLEGAIEGSDVLITSGGVSVGAKDLVKDVWREIGAKELIWQVSIRPGKPFYFAMHGNKTIFGLPGNPVSALVCFQLFVRPALLKMMGAPDKALEPVSATLTSGVARQPNRTDFARGILRAAGGGYSANPLKSQDSHMLTGLVRANCLLCIPPGRGNLRSGEPVDAYAIDWGAPAI
jgi:molybdopterin molybdotransferase